MHIDLKYFTVTSSVQMTVCSILFVLMNNQTTWTFHFTCVITLVQHFWNSISLFHNYFFVNSNALNYEILDSDTVQIHLS